MACSWRAITSAGMAFHQPFVWGRACMFAVRRVPRPASGAALPDNAPGAWPTRCHSTSWPASSASSKRPLASPSSATASIPRCRPTAAAGAAWPWSTWRAWPCTASGWAARRMPCMACSGSTRRRPQGTPGRSERRPGRLGRASDRPGTCGQAQVMAPDKVGTNISEHARTRNRALDAAAGCRNPKSGRGS